MKHPVFMTKKMYCDTFFDQMWFLAVFPFNVCQSIFKSPSVQEKKFHAFYFFIICFNFTGMRKQREKLFGGESPFATGQLNEKKW